MRILPLLIAAIFLAELLVMALLSNFSGLPSFLEWLLDSFLLCIFVLPALYIFAIKPVLREKRSAEEARKRLELYANHAEETSRQVQSFAYTVAHDLRGPLVNIKGFTKELLLISHDLSKTVDKGVTVSPTREGKRFMEIVSQEVPEAVAFISNGAEKMDDLLNSILEVARLGYRELKITEVQLKDVAATLVAGFENRLAQQKIAIKIGELPTVATDKFTIERIIFELLDNAIKYMEREEEGTIEIKGWTEETALLLQVSDNGRGIPLADQEKIFEIFRRSGTCTVAGEGIGLARVQTLTRRAGGRASCESAPGKGSTFTVFIPLTLS